MPIEVLYHGTNGDNALRILRQGIMRPRDGRIFFCKHESQLPTLFMHGADTSRHAAFVIRAKVHIPAHDQFKAVATPGVPDTWVLRTHAPVKAEIDALLIRRKPGELVSTVTGPREINNVLLLMDRRIHPVFKVSLEKIVIDLDGLRWQPYVDNITRSSAEQAEKMKQGYSRTMRSWNVDTTSATLPYGHTSLDVVHGNAADIVDVRYKWGGAAANKDLQFWKDLGRIAKEHGCEWGGDWKMRDVAHIQMLFIESRPRNEANA